ncbi:MAG: DUF4365 domain-containing protein [Chloroflexales bacterium]|nr:DUF4365 domain-containing protein [Chloroflexales bacterium]
MDLSQRKEQFSIAFVRAIASVAGYAVYKQEVDEDSVDIGIAARGGAGTVRSPRLELQLKCTAQAVWRQNKLLFPLKKKNYDDLRGEDLLVPRILVVLCVPNQLDDWLTHSSDALVLRYCAYWLSLRLFEERQNARSVTVTLPQANAFTVAALHAMMQSIARKEFV